VSVIFLHAMLWPWAVLALLPLLVHLFARARPRVIDFSSVAFIQRALRFTQRVRKPKDWLLLFLRTAAAVAVFFVFLRPTAFSRGGGFFDPRRVVVIVDASASMGWSDGSQTRFAQACAEASQVLSGLSSRDTADVVLAAATPKAVFPTLGGNVGYLQEELRRARLTSEALDPDAALRLAARLLEKREGRKEVCVVSDFQASNWRGVRSSLPPNVGFSCVTVAHGEAPNAAVVRLTIDSARPLLGEEATVLCEAANYSGTPQRKTVVLASDALHASREVVIPAWGRATAAFKSRVSSLTPLKLEVSLSEDAFPGDDRRWATGEPSEALRVSICGQGKGAATADSWARGCRALGWARTDVLAPDALRAQDLRCDVLLLAGWDGSTPECVHRLLTRGVPVVWYPAPETPLSRLATVLTNAPPASPGGATAAWTEFPDGVPLKVSTPDSPIFGVFMGGEYGDPAHGRVRGRLTLSPADLPPGDPLLSYPDGMPAVWVCRGSLPLVLWNILLDKNLSSFQNQGEYVPFLGELLLGVRRGALGSVQSATEKAPGQTLAWRPDIDVRPDEVQFCGPDGVPLPASPSASGDATFVSTPLARLGVYTWSAGGREIGAGVINFPVVESDLRTLTGAEIKALGARAASSGRTVCEWQEGVPLWPGILWGALALLLCEGAVATLDGRKKPAASGAASGTSEKRGSV